MKPITVDDLRRSFEEAIEWWEMENHGDTFADIRAEAARRYPEKEDGNGEGV